MQSRRKWMIAETAEMDGYEHEGEMGAETIMKPAAETDTKSRAKLDAKTKAK